MSLENASVVADERCSSVPEQIRAEAGHGHLRGERARAIELAVMLRPHNQGSGVSEVR